MLSSSASAVSKPPLELLQVAGGEDRLAVGHHAEVPLDSPLRLKLAAAAGDLALAHVPGDVGDAREAQHGEHRFKSSSPHGQHSNVRSRTTVPSGERLAASLPPFTFFAERSTPALCSSAATLAGSCVAGQRMIAAL